MAERNEIRVFKKSSSSGNLTVYLGKRDFVDHVAYVDPIDGVVLIDLDYVKDKKVFGRVLATFSYGRDDLDVLGLTFRKELYIVNEQIYPDPNRPHFSKQCPYYIEGKTENVPVNPNYLRNSNNYNFTINTNDKPSNQSPQEHLNLSTPSSSSSSQQQQPLQRPLTRLQERLIRKLGKNAFPFFFELPPLCPASVTLQPGPGECGKPCGIDYELEAYIVGNSEKPQKKDSIRLAIRKIMYAPSKKGEQPMVEVSKDFMMSPNKMNLEVSLDKGIYHHGESIAVNVHIANNSNRTVKKVKVSVRQIADICLFSTAQYKCTVAEIESEEGCPVGPGATLSKVYYLRPTLADNKDKRGLALDGQLKHEDTNLASSTLLTESSQKENLGIVVQYKVRVKISLGPLGGDIQAELPVILMHPKPVGEGDNFDYYGGGGDKSQPLGINKACHPFESLFSRSLACRCYTNSTDSTSSRRTTLAREANSSSITDCVTTEPTAANDNVERMNVDEGGVQKDNLTDQTEQADLIQLDDDNDIIFEEFARLQLNSYDPSSCMSNKETPDEFQSSFNEIERNVVKMQAHFHESEQTNIPESPQQHQDMNQPSIHGSASDQSNIESNFSP